VSATAIGEYTFAARDAVGNFRLPLIYIGWDDHQMFCAPLCLALPGDLLFGDLVDGVLPGLFGEHPDFARIDWPRAQWFKAATLWTPKPALSLAANGLRHKDLIRFRTPGLEGLHGSFS
jgi:phenol hydroxylase P4 protein